MTAYTKKYLELIFPGRATIPGDIHIIQPATFTEPGRAKLGAARKGTQVNQDPPTFQLLSSNGGAFFGLFAEGGEPLKPYDTTYWLEEENGNGPH